MLVQAGTGGPGIQLMRAHRVALAHPRFRFQAVALRLGQVRGGLGCLLHEWSVPVLSFGDLHRRVLEWVVTSMEEDFEMRDLYRVSLCNERDCLSVG